MAITASIGTTYLGASGTVIGATVGDWVRVFELSDSGTVEYDQRYDAHPMPVGAQVSAASLPRWGQLSFAVLSTTTATTAGTAGREAAALDEWRLLNALFKPYTGRQHLTVTRKNAADADVVSVALVEVSRLPGARVGDPGVGDKWPTGNLRYPVECVRPFPFWWAATATATDTTEIGAAAGTATVTVNASAVAKCGARLTFGSVDGSITRVRVQNTTTGDEFTVNKAAGFANGDYVDFYHADKLGQTNPHAGTTGGTFKENAGGEALMSFWLQPGANSISATRIDGAGTAVLTIAHQALYGSI